MSRQNGYYVCQIPYDMTRDVYFWDGTSFLACGNEAQFYESEFTHIAALPIDLHSNQWDMLEVKS